MSDHLGSLDNPVWSSLTTEQKEFAISSESGKRYRPDLLPFAALKVPDSKSIEGLNTLLQSGEIIYLLGDIPKLPSHWKLLKDLPILQMVLETKISSSVTTMPVTTLEKDKKMDMFDLINRVQPGYYLPDSHLVGRYYGIWQDDKLVSIIGERMRLKHLTEISAICTDPAFTGRKYAQQLIGHLCATLQAEETIPFLHVLETNERAIRLYEFLGFRRRRTIRCYQIRVGNE